MKTMEPQNREAAIAAAKARAAQTYDMAADCFDATPLAFWSRIGQSTVERLALQPSGRVLDVGCGTGASAIPAALAVGPYGSVTGIDLSEKLLSLARRKAAADGLKQAEFRRSDMTATGYPDAMFDAVISVFSIFFVPDMEAQVAELWRMVRPGGTLAITTWGGEFLAPAYARFNEAVARERPDLVAAFNPWDRITTPDAVVTLFADAGVPRGRVSVVPQDAAQPLSAPEDWWTIIRGSGLRWTAEALGPDAAARVREDNIGWIRHEGIDSVAVNGIYATATKPA